MPKKNDQTPEFSEKESQKLAFVIEQIKVWLPELDLKYAKALVKQMQSDAHTYHSAAPLIRGYQVEKGQLMGLQAAALQSIIDMTEKLIKCDEKKKEIAEKAVKMDELEKMFW